MASLSTWYSTQYSPWNRTRRLAMPPFLARAENLPPLGESVIINMSTINQLQTSASPLATPSASDKSKNETLFGPPIGVGNTSNVPEWARGSQNATSGNSTIPPEVVKDWIAKRKQEPSKPAATTTLQALVNLKRPSIRLTPLSNPASDPTSTPVLSTISAHGLEFDFDCDAARCNVMISAIPFNFSTAPSNPIVLLDQAVDGGFGRTLRLEDGAILELSKLEIELRGGDSSEHKTPLEASGPLPANGNTPQAPGGSTNDPSASNSHLAAPPTNNTKKRLSAFHFRRKHDRQAVGPSLQVVDAEVEEAIQAARRASAEDHDMDDPTLNPNHGEGPSKIREQEANNSGVRITIRLEALDEKDAPLLNNNIQTTYLHILRTGSSPEGPEEDSRAWVVKVVKREACIGSHTFRLQEIYGLASQSQPAVITSTPTVYPPTTAPVNSSWDTPSTECVLCLSSPREVVLLPCRHLVACRECAVNMIEFGAGGQLTHEIEASAATNTSTGGEASGDLENGLTGGTPTTTNPTTTLPPRRKRKAKGWFCPVCRQPYTSLLRITPHPPGKSLEDDSSTLQSRDASPSPVVTSPPDIPTPGTPEVTPPVPPAPAATRSSGGGGLGNVFANLRLNGSKQTRPNAGDLESGSGGGPAVNGSPTTPAVT